MKELENHSALVTEMAKRAAFQATTEATQRIADDVGSLKAELRQLRGPMDR